MPKLLWASKRSDIDNVVRHQGSICPLLLPHMKQAEDILLFYPSRAHRHRWGNRGGESARDHHRQYLAADGIVNVLRVLEGLEDEKIHGLKFVELNACSGGCVGGVLTVENPYVAREQDQKDHRYLPVSQEAIWKATLIWTLCGTDASSTNRSSALAVPLKKAFI